MAPIKKVSIPRLELCAALHLAKLFHKVNLILQFEVNNVVLFSDSTVTLSWIKSSPHKWKTFVANRVSMIQDLSPNCTEGMFDLKIILLT